MFFKCKAVYFFCKKINYKSKVYLCLYKYKKYNNKEYKTVYISRD